MYLQTTTVLFERGLYSDSEVKYVHRRLESVREKAIALLRGWAEAYMLALPAYKPLPQPAADSAIIIE